MDWNDCNWRIVETEGGYFILKYRYKFDFKNIFLSLIYSLFSHNSYYTYNENLDTKVFFSKEEALSFLKELKEEELEQKENERLYVDKMKEKRIVYDDRKALCL